MPRLRGLIRGAASSGDRRGCAPGMVASALAACVALGVAMPSAAAKLREVRVGRHAEYTRIVFETDAPVRYRVTRDESGELRVRLEATASPRRVGSKSEVLREVVVEGEGTGSVARLALARGEVDVREMVLENPPRIVLDLTPRVASATAVAERAKPRPVASEARRTETARAPAPAPAPKPARAPAAAAPAARPAPGPVPAPVLAAAPPAEPKAAPEGAPTPVAPAPAGAVSPPPEERVRRSPAPAPTADVTPPPPAQERVRPAPAPAPATEPAPRVAPATELAGPPAPPRQAPLELRLGPEETPENDAAAARLAKAERELEKLAGISEKPRLRKAAPELPAPAPEAPAPAAPVAVAAPSATAPPTAPAAAAAPVPSSPAAEPPAPAAAPLGVGSAGAADAAAPAPTADAAPAPGTGAEVAPGAPAEPAPAAPEKKAKRARAPEAFEPTPEPPGWLAFLPAPFDDPLVLGGIGALLALIAALAVVRRRATRETEAFASPFDAAEPLEAAGGSGLGVEQGSAGAASFEPVSTSPVAAPTAEMGPLFASATVVDDDEASIFDVTAEDAVAEDVDTPSVPAPPAFEPAAPALGAASEPIDETELTEEEMRLIEELERRLAHLETRLEEVVDAKERLERHVAAQTEELRVQRAAIARTQRVLRTVVKPDDVATEPVAKT